MAKVCRYSRPNSVCQILKLEKNKNISIVLLFLKKGWDEMHEEQKYNGTNLPILEPKSGNS